MNHMLLFISSIILLNNILGDFYIECYFLFQTFFLNEENETEKWNTDVHVNIFTLLLYIYKYI